MLDHGRVIKIKGNLAEVEFAASSACAGCGACHAGSGGKMTVEAENTVGAGLGDGVEVEVCEAIAALFPLIGFGIPLGFFFLGLVLGSLVSENAGIIAGAVFLGIGFLVVRIADRYVSRQKKFKSRIVRIEKSLGGEGAMAVEKDPVCGMECTDSKISSTYQGRTFHFCSEGCKASFDRDPEKYIKKAE